MEDSARPKLSRDPRRWHDKTLSLEGSNESFKNQVSSHKLLPAPNVRILLRHPARSHENLANTTTCKISSVFQIFLGSPGITIGKRIWPQPNSNPIVSRDPRGTLEDRWLKFGRGQIRDPEFHVSYTQCPIPEHLVDLGDHCSRKCTFQARLQPHPQSTHIVQQLLLLFPKLCHFLPGIGDLWRFEKQSEHNLLWDAWG